MEGAVVQEGESAGHRWRIEVPRVLNQKLQLDYQQESTCQTLSNDWGQYGAREASLRPSDRIKAGPKLRKPAFVLSMGVLASPHDDKMLAASENILAPSPLTCFGGRTLAPSKLCLLQVAHKTQPNHRFNV